MRTSRAIAKEEKPVRGVLLTMDKAAERSGLSKWWFYKHMQDGTLPIPWFQMTAGKRLVDSADIDDLLRMRKIPAGTMPGRV
jgi:predicted DNA-binding transcriptional regulator AlpA